MNTGITIRTQEQNRKGFIFKENNRHSSFRIYGPRTRRIIGRVLKINSRNKENKSIMLGLLEITLLRLMSVMWWAMAWKCDAQAQSNRKWPKVSNRKFGGITMIKSKLRKFFEARELKFNNSGLPARKVGNQSYFKRTMRCQLLN